MPEPGNILPFDRGDPLHRQRLVVGGTAEGYTGFQTDQVIANAGSMAVENSVIIANESTITALYERHAKHLFRIAALLVGPDAANIALVDSLTSMNNREYPGDDLLPHARAALIRWTRLDSEQRAADRNQAPWTLTPDTPPARWTPYEQLEQSPIYGALQLLGSRQREAIVLRYFAGMSDQEIAVAMGETINQIQIRMAGGMEKLLPILSTQ